MRVLFWNASKNPAAVQLALDQIIPMDLDLLLMAEAPLLGLPSNTEPIASPERGGIQAIRRTGSSLHVRELGTMPNGRMRAFGISRVGATKRLLLFGTHFSSRVNHLTEYRQANETESHVLWIEAMERKYTDSSLVVGDLNMDPYSPSMVYIRGFNALMTARQKARRAGGFERRTFFNPMWRFYGHPPYGTYYLKKPQELGYHWHMLDQVLLRNELASHLDEIQILTKLGDQTLVSAQANLPIKKFSDHLPLFFCLNNGAFEAAPFPKNQEQP